MIKQVSVWALGVSIACFTVSSQALAQDVGAETAAETAPDAGDPPTETQTPPPMETMRNPPKAAAPKPRPPSKPRPRAPVKLSLPVTANAYYTEDGELIRDAFSQHVLQLIEVPIEKAPVNLDQESDNLWVKGPRRPADNFLAAITYVPRDEAQVTLADGTEMRIYRAKRNADFPASEKAPDDLILTSEIYCGTVKRPSNIAPTMCFHDTDRDNQFERVAYARSEAVDNHPIGAAVMLPSAVLQSPLAYSAVAPNARTSLNFEMRNCGKDWDRPRFSVKRKVSSAADNDILLGALGDEKLDQLTPQQRQTLLRLVRGRVNSGSRNTPTCQRGDRIESFGSITEKSLEKKHILTDLDGLIFSIGPKKEGASVKLVGARARAGDMRLEGGVLQPVDSGLSKMQKPIATTQRFDRSAFMSTGEMTAAPGEVGLGETVFEVPFDYGYMGELAETSRIRTLLTSRSVKGGTLLYGIPMSSRRITTYGGAPMGPFGGAVIGNERWLTTQLTWCAPGSGEKAVYERVSGKMKETGTKTVWSATCFTQLGDQHTIVKGRKPAFAVNRVGHTANISTNDGTPPITQLDRTGFDGQAKLRYFFEESKVGKLRLMQEVMIGDVPTGAVSVDSFFGIKGFGEKDGKRSYFWSTAGGRVTIKLVSGQSAETIKRKASREEKAAILSAEREEWSFTASVTSPPEKGKQVSLSSQRRFGF